MIRNWSIFVLEGGSIGVRLSCVRVSFFFYQSKQIAVLLHPRFTYRKMFRRVVVLVQVNPDTVVALQLVRFAQLLDEFLHVLHGLFVRFAAHLLQMERDKCWLPGRDVIEKLFDP